MALVQLPTEILWTIASCFCHQRDIYALIRTNRHLYKTLIKFLYCFHGHYKHGAALSFLAEQNLFLQVQRLLDGLNAARNQPQASLAVLEATEDKAPKMYEEEDTVPRRTREKCDPTDPYCQDIFTHPLFQQGYSIPSVVNIQHALVVAIQGGHTKIVAVLLDFGAQANFYYGGRVQCLFPQHTRNWWHGKEVDYPPLFTAVQFGNLELVKLLLQRGADPELYAPSPLYCAVKDDRRDIIPVLLEHGVGPQATALKLLLRTTTRPSGLVTTPGYSNSMTMPLVLVIMIILTLSLQVVAVVSRPRRRPSLVSLRLLMSQKLTCRS